MAGNQGAVVFSLVVAFDSGEGEVTEESAGGDEEGHEAGLPPEEGGDPSESDAEGGSSEDSSDGSFEGLVRGDVRGDGSFANGLSPDVLKDVTALADDDEEEEELGSGSPVAEGEQRRGVGEGVDADGEGPVAAGGAEEKVVGGLSENVADGEKDKSEDGEKDGPDGVKVESKEAIVEGKENEKRPSKGAVVTPVSGHNGGEFAQSLERHEGEQQKRANFSEKRSCDEKGDHEPPGVGALAEVLAELGVFSNGCEAAEGGDEEGC